MLSTWQLIIFSSTLIRRVWARTFIGKVVLQDTPIIGTRMEIKYIHLIQLIAIHQIYRLVRDHEYSTRVPYIIYITNYIVLVQ